MKFNLTDKELKLLNEADILYSPEREYDDKSAFEFLEKIYEREVFFAQDADRSKKSRDLASAYAKLADKVQMSILE